MVRGKLTLPSKLLGYLLSDLYVSYGILRLNDRKLDEAKVGLVKAVLGRGFSDRSTQSHRKNMALGQLRADPPTPRLEAKVSVDVGGIAFRMRYPTRPVNFIQLTPVNISKTVSPNHFCSNLEPGSYY